MLQRIYGTAWGVKAARRAPDQLEAASDHRRASAWLGPALVPRRARRSPVWHPKGAIVRKLAWRTGRQRPGRAATVRLLAELANGLLPGKAGHLGFYAGAMPPAMELDGADFLPKAHELPVPHPHLQGQPALRGAAVPPLRAGHGLTATSARARSTGCSASGLHPGRQPHLRHARQLPTELASLLDFVLSVLRAFGLRGLPSRSCRRAAREVPRLGPDWAAPPTPALGHRPPGLDTRVDGAAARSTPRSTTCDAIGQAGSCRPSRSTSVRTPAFDLEVHRRRQPAPPADRMIHRALFGSSSGSSACSRALRRAFPRLAGPVQVRVHRCATTTSLRPPSRRPPGRRGLPGRHRGGGRRSWATTSARPGGEAAVRARRGRRRRRARHGQGQPAAARSGGVERRRLRRAPRPPTYSLARALRSRPPGPDRGGPAPRGATGRCTQRFTSAFAGDADTVVGARRRDWRGLAVRLASWSTPGRGDLHPEAGRHHRVDPQRLPVQQRPDGGAAQPRVPGSRGPPPTSSPRCWDLVREAVLAIKEHARQGVNVGADLRHATGISALPTTSHVHCLPHGSATELPSRVADPGADLGVTGASAAAACPPERRPGGSSPMADEVPGRRGRAGPAGTAPAEPRRRRRCSGGPRRHRLIGPTVPQQHDRRPRRIYSRHRPRVRAGVEADHQGGDPVLVRQACSGQRHRWYPRQAHHFWPASPAPRREDALIGRHAGRPGRPHRTMGWRGLQPAAWRILLLRRTSRPAAAASSSSTAGHRLSVRRDNRTGPDSGTTERRHFTTCTGGWSIEGRLGEYWNSHAGCGPPQAANRGQ